MKKTAFLSMLLCLCMVLSLIVIPAQPAAANEVDTSVLDGVYEADFYGTIMYVMTFDNGVLTIEDKNNGALTGEYTYTVEDGTPIVNTELFIMGKDMGGFLTIQPAGFMMPMTLTKVAELGDVPATPDAPAIDTSVLDGVYEASFGDLMYTITFDNGVMTIVDAPAAANFPLEGEYTYTVEDGEPIVDTEAFLLSRNPGGFLTIQPAGFMIPMDMEKVAELGGAATPDEPVIDTSVLDGVYEASFGDLMYTITFDNGVMTIVDAPAAANFPLEGEYTYTVENGEPIVETEAFLLGRNPGGFLTIQPSGFMMPMDLEKVAELDGSTETPDEPEVPDEPELPDEIVFGEEIVTITDNNCWVDELVFTAPVAGTYTFVVPAGVGMANADEMDGPTPWSATVYRDYNNKEAGMFTIQLAANETIRFYVGALEKNVDVTIAWTTDEVTMEEEEELVAEMGDNTVVVDEAAIAEGAVIMTFVVETADTYRFSSLNDALFVRILSNGMPVGAGTAYLEPGTYTLVVIPAETLEPGEYVLNIATVDLDQEAAEEMIAQIEALGEITLDSKEAIEAARLAYDAMTDEAKALVTNLAVLEAAEAAYEALVEASKPADPETPEDNKPAETKPAETNPSNTTPAPTQPEAEPETTSPVVFVVIAVVVVAAIVAVVVIMKKKSA